MVRFATVTCQTAACEKHILDRLSIGITLIICFFSPFFCMNSRFGMTPETRNFPKDFYNIFNMRYTSILSFYFTHETLLFHRVAVICDGLQQAVVNLRYRNYILNTIDVCMYDVIKLSIYQAGQIGEKIY